MFKRRKGGSAEDGEAGVAESAQPEQAVAETAAAPTTGEGPFDIHAAPGDEIARVDLGVKPLCEQRLHIAK